METFVHTERAELGLQVYIHHGRAEVIVGSERPAEPGRSHHRPELSAVYRDSYRRPASSTPPAAGFYLGTARLTARYIPAHSPVRLGCLHPAELLRYFRISEPDAPGGSQIL
ncbi:perilipin-3 [Sarotherodon galilaeus]